MLIINCAQTVAAIAPVLNTCPFEMPKSGKIVFRKRGGATALLIATSGSGSVALSATWTTMLAASDETKAIATAKVTSINITAPEVPLVDSGSSTGIQRTRTVVPPAQFSCRMFGVTPAFVAELKKLSQFSYALMGDTNLEAFIFDEKNNIFCLKNSTAATGIPIYNLEFSSTAIEDGEDFSNPMIKFQMQHAWDDTLEKVACSFTAMTTLVN